MARINSRLACGGKRKQASFGAILGGINAATGLASSIFGGISSKKQQEELERQQQNQTIMQRNNQLASVYNSTLASNKNLSNTDYTNNIIYRCGGRKKARNGKRSKLTTPYITDGGIAIPMGNGLSLLRGATHEDINETGQTGIGIQVGRHQIEAQDGEVAQKKGRELRIFSDEPLLYGVSPADAVEAGYNPDIIFAAQEAYKNINGISDDGNLYKCGGRKKAINGLVDGIYNEVLENDATRTWSSSYNGRERSIPYGAIENVGDGAYLTPVDLAIGEILMPALYAIDEELAPLDYDDNIRQAGVGPFIGKPRFARPRRIRPNKNLQSKRTQNANRKAEAKVRAVEQAVADKPVVRAIRGQRWTNPATTAYGQPIEAPIRVATRGQIPANAIPEGSLEFTTPGLKRQILANRLARIANSGKQKVKQIKENISARRAANRTQEDSRTNNTNTDTNTNTNNNTNNSRLNRVKGAIKRNAKKTGIGAGIVLGAGVIGTAINKVLSDRAIVANNKGNTRNRTQSTQSTKANSNNSTQSSRPTQTTQTTQSIQNTKPSNKTTKSTKRRRLNKRKEASKEKLLKAIKFVAPETRPITPNYTRVDYRSLTPEQIEILKEEISQLPRSRSKFGTTTPVERLRRKYPNGGNIYNYADYLTPRETLPTVIGFRSLPKSGIKLDELNGLGGNTVYNPVLNNNNTIANNNESTINNPIFLNDNNKLGLNIKGADWIGLGTDILGSIGIGLFNNQNLKDLNYNYTLPQYIDETPVAFDTTYHNGAQRANVERNRINARNIIGRNTASANTAVQRMQESDTNAMMEQNKLWDEKANKEMELRNLAAQNEQQVRARNAAARNAYYQQVAEIRNREVDQNNAIRMQQGQALNASLAGISQAASNFLSQAGQRYEDSQALKALAASRGAILPTMLAAGVDLDDDTIAGMIYNYQQRLKQPLIKPNKADYNNEAAYGEALKNYENALKENEQFENAINLGTAKLSRSRRGKRHLNRLGLL